MMLAFVRWLFSSIARNRLVQFLLIGGLIYFVAPKETPAWTIEISQEQLVESYSEKSRAQNGRTLSLIDRQQALDALVEEELLLREARSIGLDRQDAQIRTRMIQRMISLTEGRALLSAPDDEQVKAYYNKHRAEFVSSSRFSGSYVFVPGSESDSTQQTTYDLLIRGQFNGEPHNVVDMPVGTAEQAFGKEVSQTIFNSDNPTNEWLRPIKTSRGWYLFKVTSRTPSEPLPLNDQVRAIITQALTTDARRAAREIELQRLGRKYTIRVNAPAGAPNVPSLKPVLEASTKKVLP